MNNFLNISGSHPLGTQKKLNPNVIGAAASVGASAIGAANIGSQSYGNLQMDGYRADGAAAGASFGSALGPVGMLGGALAGTAYDIFAFNKRKKAFEKEKTSMGIRDWRNTLNAGQSDATGQFYL